MPNVCTCLGTCRKKAGTVLGEGWYCTLERKPEPVKNPEPMKFADEIAAAHPANTGRHDIYELAAVLVGERHEKADLINLVNFLLAKNGDV